MGELFYVFHFLCRTQRIYKGHTHRLTAPMPPKKTAAKGQPVKVDVPQSGLMEEGCTLPLWEDADIAQEDWGGDLTAAPVQDSSQLFVDPEWSCVLDGCFGGFLAAWKRPSSIFSPFKPMVYRPQLLEYGNPYTCDPEVFAADDEGSIMTNGPEGGHGSESPRGAQPLAADSQPTTSAELIAMYRRMRPQVPVPLDKTPAAVGAGGDGGSSPTRRRMRRRELRSDMPFFMRAFNSALMALQLNQKAVAPGRYAWELIHPQANSTGFPVYNVHGKYVVKLFVRGAFRRVVVDDRMPVDATGDSLLSVTDQKEIWPALLLKAILKAMGPGHEQALMRDPTWILCTLLGGYLPERIDPLLSEMRASDCVSRHLGRPDGQHILCAYVREDKGKAKGLEAGQLYAVVDAKLFQNSRLLRLYGFNAQWKGTFAFDSPTWTVEVEESLGFDPQKSRDRHALHNRWNDFWIMWEDFVETFETLTLLHPVALDTARYGTFKQITHVVEAPQPVVGGRGGAAAKETPRDKNAPPLPNHSTSSHHRPLEGREYVKWLRVDSTGADEEVPMLVVLLGTPQGKILPTISICIDKYDWTRRGPFSTVLDINRPWSHYDSHPLYVPQGGTHYYRVTVTGLPAADAAVSILGPRPFMLGDEKEVLKELGVATVTDGGVYGVHEPNVATLWFKRILHVKAPTVANFKISVLPSDADVAPYKMNLIDSVAVGGAKGGKGTNPKAAAQRGGGSVSTAARGSPSPSSPQPEVPALNDDDPAEVTAARRAFTHEAMRDHVMMTLINLDNEEATTDTLGTINQTEMHPNKNGYLLMAYGVNKSSSPAFSYPGGKWKLRITSNAPIDNVEARNFDENYSKAAVYHHSTARTLFRLNITTLEPCTGTLQATLHGAPVGVAFQVRVLHDGEEVTTRQGQEWCLVEHLTFMPPEKNSPSTYTVIGTLEQTYPEECNSRRREGVINQYKKDSEEQAARVQAYVDGVLGLIEQGDLSCLSPPPAAEPAPTSKGVTIAAPTPVAPARPSIPLQLTEEAGRSSTALNQSGLDFGMSYSFVLHASTTRLEITDDTATAEETARIRAAWAKRDHPDEPVPQQKGRPPKGQPLVDESVVRAQKAKEARLRFLANPTGIFVPFMAAAPSATAVTPQAAAPLAKVGVPIDAAPTTTAGGNQVFTKVSAGPSLRYAPPASPTPVEDLPDVKAPDEAKAQFEGDASPSTLVDTPQHKAYLQANHDRLVGLLSQHRDKRKALFVDMNERLYQSYDVRRPATVDPEEEKKKKKK